MRSRDPLRNDRPRRDDDDEPWYNPSKTPLANLVLGFWAIVIVLVGLLAVLAVILKLFGVKW